MKKTKYLAGVALILVLFFFLPGCAGIAVIPAEAPDAAVDYNVVYRDGGLFYYWVWDPVGFWVFTQTVFLPPSYAGRRIYYGHYPGHWGNPGHRRHHASHGGIHRGSGTHKGGSIHKSSGTHKGGGVHRPSGGGHKSSGSKSRSSGGGHRKR